MPSSSEDAATTAKQYQENLKKVIRAFEADNGIRPSKIEFNADGGVSVTIDKTVLAKLDNQYVKNFTTTTHATSLQAKIKQDQNIEVGVTVSKKNAKLAIPYFDIPLPWERSATPVRMYHNLVTQDVKVKITFPQNTPPETALKTIINAATASQEVAQSAAKRPSHNPLKWLLHKLSFLMPRALAQWFPNILIKTARRNDWGTQFAEYQLDKPYINSTTATHFLNAGLTGTGLATLNGFRHICQKEQESDDPVAVNFNCSGEEPDESESDVKDQHYHANDIVLHTYTSPFAATRTKVTPSSEEVNSQTRIDDAVQKATRSVR